MFKTPPFWLALMMLVGKCMILYSAMFEIMPKIVESGNAHKFGDMFRDICGFVFCILICIYVEITAKVTKPDGD